MKEDSLEITGYRFSAVAAGIKQPGSERRDLALICADRPATAACVTTTNLVCAAPVEITRERFKAGSCQAILINSGNANAVTGRQGIDDALVLLDQVAQHLNIDRRLVAPMSTGVIGAPLPVDRMRAAVPELVAGLDATKAPDVATAMMTTDTRPKTVLLNETIGGRSVRILGMVKGAGMIAPNMATLLAVALVDVRVEAVMLGKALRDATRNTFNAITIDGDTSTNDTVIALTGGAPFAEELGSDHDATQAFAGMLQTACANLARQVAADGEGATKLVEIRVRGARDKRDALTVARTIAESPLVKTAFYGQDPNWGRIIAAAGRSGVSFDPDRLDLFIDGIPVLKNGAPRSDEWEPQAAQAMKKREFFVLLDLNHGTAEASMLTTDLSEEYVRINAAYRT
ncbi:MAG: bifunctional glutamate N-acetyltransferase/amino-acid acetyltransferase ArgJ [Deltaproteobacteria bacterium]|nr:bifunctional glutamate N-acetyltransferase/amino-acid acetyltransferase ArgJ [Deltaproteobacteria bacterium]